MIDWQEQRVLLVSAHRDDVELGAGGTIHHLADHRIYGLYHISFSNPPGVDPVVFNKEHLQSIDMLHVTDDVSLDIIEYSEDPRKLYEKRDMILDVLYNLNNSYRPTVVFCPCSTDIHQSHQVVHQECLRAFKYCTILGYEMPWNTFEFNPGVFSILDKEDHDAKLAAIACYKTQQSRTFFSNGVVGDLMRVRGKQVNREYAEAFEAIRIFI
jgi:LmbE family N-acetylglucosaminyl deacetylase